jgi:phage gp46-like protein
VTDIATKWATTHGDWALAGGDLAGGDDLATAVIISLFTDRQAEVDDTLLDGTTDRRGWWADDQQQRIGSRLWLLDRSKRTQQTLQAAKGYIEEALQWMVADGVAAGIRVAVEWAAGSQLSAQVMVLRVDGSQHALNFSWAWDAQR